MMVLHQWPRRPSRSRVRTSRCWTPLVALNAMALSTSLPNRVVEDSHEQIRSVAAALSPSTAPAIFIYIPVVISRPHPFIRVGIRAARRVKRWLS